MAKFYGVKIKKDGMKLEEVPKFWRNKTKEWLDINS